MILNELRKSVTIVTNKEAEIQKREAMAITNRQC